MVTASKGRNHLGASVAINFNKQYAVEVSWQKVGETDASVEDEGITDGGSESGDGGGGTNLPGELEE